jgi:hypothetical protein
MQKGFIEVFCEPLFSALALLELSEIEEVHMENLDHNFAYWEQHEEAMQTSMEQFGNQSVDPKNAGSVWFPPSDTEPISPVSGRQRSPASGREHRKHLRAGQEHPHDPLHDTASALLHNASGLAIHFSALLHTDSGRASDAESHGGNSGSPDRRGSPTRSEQTSTSQAMVQGNGENPRLKFDAPGRGKRIGREMVFEI